MNPSELETGVATIARRLRRGPEIPPGVYLAPTATVLGEVLLGEEASVWFGAVLRGDINRIAVGTRSNIQDNAIVHVSGRIPCSHWRVGHGGARRHRSCLHGWERSACRHGRDHSRRRGDRGAFHHWRSGSRDGENQDTARIARAGVSRQGRPAIGHGGAGKNRALGP